jgi:hypothetical protein
VQSQTVVCERNEHLIYCCIRCGTTWTANGDDPNYLRDLIELNKVDISHGYCPICLRGERLSGIRRSQRREGYPDCYLRRDTCNELACCYRSSCDETEIEKWKGRIIQIKPHNEGL